MQPVGSIFSDSNRLRPPARSYRTGCRVQNRANGTILNIAFQSSQFRNGSFRTGFIIFILESCIIRHWGGRSWELQNILSGFRAAEHAFFDAKFAAFRQNGKHEAASLVEYFKVFAVNARSL